MLRRCVSQLLIFVVLVAAAVGASAQDKWLGGSGNWNYAPNWSGGVPNGSSIVVIATSSDSVTLDAIASSASLTLGDTFSPQASSDLEIFNGSLTVAGQVTVNPSGRLDVFSSFPNSFGSINNQGVVFISNSSSLDIANPFTDVPVSAFYLVYGNFSSGAGSGFKKLQSVEGFVLLINGQNNVIAPGSGTLNINSSANAVLLAEGGSTVTVIGNLVNSSTVYTWQGNIDVSGSFVNNLGSYLLINHAGDVGNIGGLSNFGNVLVGTGATLNLTNQPGGLTDVIAGSSFDLAGTFSTGSNNGLYHLTSVEGSLILENSQTTTTTPIGGTFTVGSTGYVEVKSGTTFNINGSVTVNQGGILSVNDPLPTTVNITGMLTNLGGQVNVVGPTAFLNVGGIGNGGTLTLPEGSTVNLANGFYQLASGTLGETIGATGFAIVSVNGGLVMLDGTLDVLLDPGFNPAIGSTFRFLLFNPGVLSGTFTSIQNDIFNGGTEKWQITYDNADGYVELTATSAAPEPGTCLLVGSGLLSLLYRTRRRLA